jgi:hypothetical protein
MVVPSLCGYFRTKKISRLLHGMKPSEKGIIGTWPML